METDEHDRHVLMSMVAILASFKLVTSLLIFAVFPSLETALVLVGLSVIWLLVAAWWGASRAHTPLRLLRARARRRRLIQQEWRIE